MVLGVSAFDSFDDVSLSESLGAASFLPGIFDRSCNVFVFLMFLLSYDDTLTILSGVEYRLLNRHTGALDIILFVSFSGIIFHVSASDSVSWKCVRFYLSITYVAWLSYFLVVTASMWSIACTISF